MNIKQQRKLAARTLGISAERIWFDNEKADEINSAITREDIRKLVAAGAIQVKKKTGQSKSRSKLRKVQKRKGRQKGAGSKKGTLNAKITRKKRWMEKIRAIRGELRKLKIKKIISNKQYSRLYKMAGSGAIRTKSYLILLVSKMETKKTAKEKKGK